MKGFVYSMPAIKEGRPTQWSHMLGVTPDVRGAGLGARLKLAQREARARHGHRLIEWTYDPLQALNAHLNFAKLGVVVEEYEENIYGDSSSPLHRGTPTDRFVARVAHPTPHVERRLVAARPAGDAGQLDVVGATSSIRRGRAGSWLEPGTADLDVDAARVARRDSGRLSRDAGARSRAGARVAAVDARESSRPTSREAIAPWISSCARGGTRAVPAGEGRPRRSGLIARWREFADA